MPPQLPHQLRAGPDEQHRTRKMTEANPNGAYRRCLLRRTRGAPSFVLLAQSSATPTNDAAPIKKQGCELLVMAPPVSPVATTCPPNLFSKSLVKGGRIWALGCHRVSRQCQNGVRAHEKTKMRLSLLLAEVVPQHRAITSTGFPNSLLPCIKGWAVCWC